MADRVLRDHSKPCEHGRETSHDVPMPVVGHPEKVQLVPCPGGREVTIDYEAAQRMLDIIDQLVPPLRTADDARPIVDAALPDRDV